LKNIGESHEKIHVSGFLISCYGLYICVGSRRIVLTFRRLTSTIVDVPHR